MVPYFSPNYMLAYNAINKSLYESFNAHLGIILDMQLLSLLVKNCPIHMSRLGLALKKGKPEGRVTCNYSYGKPPSVINSDEVRQMAREYYGDIKLPTVRDLADIILWQVDRARSEGRSVLDLTLENGLERSIYTPFL